MSRLLRTLATGVARFLDRTTRPGPGLRALAVLLVTLGGLLVTGCREPAGADAPRVAMLLNLSADQTAGAIAARVTITGAGIQTPIVARANFVGTTATISVDVPVGPARTALIEILDAADVVIASGSRTFDVVAGEVANVSVPITPVNGTVVITVTIGTVTVTVTGPAGPLAVGATRQYAASVVDGTGAAIPGAVVAWATANPAIASVDASGLVTAGRAGSVEITATSRGVAGRVTVTVP